MKLLLLFAVLISFSTTSAGTNTGNGGNVFESIDGQVRFLDLVRKPGFQHYDAINDRPYQKLKKILSQTGAMNRVSFFPIDRQSVKRLDQKILEAVSRLRFIFVASELPELGDRGSVVLPWNVQGRIRRLAVQFRDNRVVLVNKKLFDRLNEKDQAAFLLHEGLIRVWYDGRLSKELESTDRIADVVQMIFNSKIPKDVSPDAIARQFCIADFDVGAGDWSGYRSKVGTLRIDTVYRETLIFDKVDCLARFLVPDGQPRQFRGSFPAREVKSYHFKETYFGVVASTSMTIVTFAGLPTELHLESDHQDIFYRMNVGPKKEFRVYERY